MTARRTRTNDAPLLEWGDALRAKKARRRRIGRRVAAAGAGLALVLLSAVRPPAPRLVWNASASAPTGLYTVTPGAWVEPGEMVIARVPLRYRALAAARRYLPMNVPLVKRVAAHAGDQVCASGQEIFVNGRRVAKRRVTDGRGRRTPTWNGCIVLRGSQIFLLMDHPESFDGRYFGPTEAADVVGKARLLWAKPARGSDNE
ncbi:S26 family signal peptidase [Sphingomonas sp. PL-96]|uniref:S26 family signal peptidase n=1 Tax=Sphingomonas sp. PL-96 TaxID=2887201 RepID=UPI001E50A3A6|nr:S26 family signal peptidase [Sphingomonas sp. PL-96]MCC2977143.1 S26 family signal peptidase [Sphingomonas sp. PL-96]